MAKNKKSNFPAGQPVQKPDFLKNVITYWLGILGMLIALSFFLQTQDSAQVKLTLFQAGSFGLLGLWLCRLYLVRVNIFTKNNAKLLLPFIIYGAYIFCSYIFMPHFTGRGAGFIYFICCAIIFTVAAFEVDERSLQKISAFIIWTCWAAFGYGALQIINNLILPGADIFAWSSFFGARVFSTFANPNFFANFCLFAIMIISARFLQTRDKKLLVLLALGLINIFFTESKGAWLALAVSGAVFAWAYINCFAGLGKKHKLQITAAALAALLLAGGITAYFAVKRMQSVNFRVYTWQSAAEMIKEKPVMGFGAGSFFIEYPSYKKPQIFYMEKLHNIQTAHAENHYLEILATQGIAGFILFLWAALYLLAGAYKKMGEKNYLLLGFGMALLSIYIHNFVDISLYLPSTGYFAAMFAGGVFALSYGPINAGHTPAAQNKLNILFFILAGMASVFFAVFAIIILKDFAAITNIASSRGVLFFISWIVLVLCIAGICFAFIKTIFTYKRISPVFILMLACLPMFFAWQIFKADHYLAVAASLQQRGDINNALLYYTDAVKYNKFSSTVYRLRADAFAARMDTARAIRPKEGDMPGKLYNDYDRAAENFETAQKLNPQEPLLYYDWGTMQREAALKAAPSARAAYYAQAEENFRRALVFDPIFENIYFQLYNVSVERDNPRAAYEWLMKYTQGPAGITERQYLDIHQNNPTVNTHLQQLREGLGIK